MYIVVCTMRVYNNVKFPGFFIHLIVMFGIKSNLNIKKKVFKPWLSIKFTFVLTYGILTTIKQYKITSYALHYIECL